MLSHQSFPDVSMTSSPASSACRTVRRAHSGKSKARALARLTVLDRRTASFHPRRAIELRHSWLLFTADFDGHSAFGRRPNGGWYR